MGCSKNPHKTTTTKKPNENKKQRPEYFHHLIPIAVNPRFSLPQLLVTTNLLSVSMDLCILDILYKWTCTVCGLLRLASFTYHNVFKVHPHCSVNPESSSCPIRSIWHDWSLLFVLLTSGAPSLLRSSHYSDCIFSVFFDASSLLSSPLNIGEPGAQTSDLFFFFFFWLCHVACGILVSQPGIETAPLAVRAQSPNRWTARDFPMLNNL